MKEKFVARVQKCYAPTPAVGEEGAVVEGRRRPVSGVCSTYMRVTSMGMR